MKLFFALLSFLILTPLCSFSQSHIVAYTSIKHFDLPSKGTLVEIQYQYAGSSVVYVKDSLGLHAAVHVKTIVFNESNQAIDSSSYLLTQDFGNQGVIDDFFDVQQFVLQPGKYSFQLNLKDLNSEQAAVVGTLETEVENNYTQVHFSDIIIAEKASQTTTPGIFTKSGYDIIPKINQFYGPQATTIPYYVELYNSNVSTDSVLRIRQRLFDNNNVELLDYNRYIKINPAPVVPLFRKMDIANLPSGSYKLTLDVVDKSGKIPATSLDYFFDRVNDVQETADLANLVLDPRFQESLTEDSLAYYLASLLPIARPAENKMILQTLKEKNKETYRKYIQQFWIQTAGTNATNAWLNYKKQVMLAEKLYRTNFQSGFETDRGRVYLQYGPPNNITVRENSPNEYPYEIWQYDKIRNFSNKRFIFYNPDLVNNAYRLLHSDMVGELQNRGWQQVLVKRNTPENNVDQLNGNAQEHFGGNSGILYRQY